MRVGLTLWLVLVGCWGLCAARSVHAETRTEANALRQAASDRTAYTLPPDKLKVAIEYTRKRTVVGFADTAWEIVQLVLLLWLGIAAWMRRVAVRAFRSRLLQGYAFYLMLLGITTALSLPLAVYGHHVSLEYGQSVQQWGSWYADRAKGFGLSYLLGGLMVMLLFVNIRRSPKRWWFWYWIPVMALTAFGVFISPVLIDPIFNHFDPLEATNPALVRQLERVVERGGIVIPPERMFLMKASAKVTGLNAYVTGIGSSKRVVVWDTSIAKATPEEISFIFGHEMGHYVLNHIYRGLALAAVGLLAMFFVGYHCVQWLLRRYGAAWGVTGQEDWAALVVMLLVLSVLTFVSEPIANGISRSQEHAADVYGQEAMHGIVADPQAVAQKTFQLLGEESLDDPTPHPLVEFWTFSHPSIASRAAFAKAYDPWRVGEEPRYFKK